MKRYGVTLYVKGSPLFDDGCKIVKSFDSPQDALAFAQSLANGEGMTIRVQDNTCGMSHSAPIKRNDR